LRPLCGYNRGMIVDDVSLTVTAGKGGDGHVSFRREKFIPRGGPDGGNGGKGGDVYFVGVSDLSALRQFRYKKHIKGHNGEHGKTKKRYGKDAEDIDIKIPIGTTVANVDSGESFSIDTVGQRELIARGGRGGRGNYEFLSNENRVPTEFEVGKEGHEKNIHLSLHFIADVGLIGLPSAGKSSLLNVLTHAEVKVGNYPFTTLEANLGEMEGIIIADIPGLILGAHEGKGLGIKFLKHIEKTKILIHCIDATSTDVVGDYHIIRTELKEFSASLIEKKEIILLTKADLVDAEVIKEQTKALEKCAEKIISTSIIDDESINELKVLIRTLF